MRGAGGVGGEGERRRVSRIVLLRCGLAGSLRRGGGHACDGGSNGAAWRRDRSGGRFHSRRRSASGGDGRAGSGKRSCAGFESDCGKNPAYCLYERAGSLADLPPEQNPRYESVDAWSFAVPLERARAYYAARYEREAPESDSVEDQARSFLRKRVLRLRVGGTCQGVRH